MSLLNCNNLYIFVTGIDAYEHTVGPTCRMASSCPPGLVPDGQAVFQEAEMSLFLPRAGFDFPQSGACHHHLDMVIVLDTC